MRDSGESPAYRAAVTLLSRKARTCREIVERLVQAGHAHDDAERAAQRLVERGLIDERAIAQAEVRAGVRAGRARAEIERSLGLRGIEESTIRAALADEEVGDDHGRAVEAARELARRAGHASPAARLRRVLAGLARRGFDDDTARNAAREVLGEMPDTGD